MAKEDILQQIEEMSVKDLAELVEMFEERFNVSAAMAAPVAVQIFQHKRHLYQAHKVRRAKSAGQ